MTNEFIEIEMVEPDPLTCCCLRCGHRWRSDTVRMLLDAGMVEEAKRALEKAPPKRCAACKSPYWNQLPIRKPQGVVNE